MSGWASFASGFQERRDDNRRSRREIAEAFSEFRRLNPEATLADMQTYIDGMAGGSNYLRGGLPSQDILRNIATENERRRADRLRQERMTELGNRAQLQGQYRALGEQFILDNEFETGADGRELFGEQYGLSGEDIESFGLGSIFTNDNVSAVRRNYANTLLPQVEDLINSTDATININALQERFPSVPRPTLQALLSSATAERQRVEAERQRQIDLENERREIMAFEREQSFRNGILSDPTFLALANRNDRSGAINHITRVASRMSPRVFELTFGVPREQSSPEMFADYFDQAIEIQRLEQENSLNANNNERRTQAAGRQGQAIESSQSIVDRVVDEVDGNPTISSVLNMLGQELVFDETLAAYVRDFTGSMLREDADSPPNSLDVVAALQADENFQVLASQPQRRLSSYRAQEPVILEAQSFDEFIASEGEDISAQVEDFVTQIDSVGRVDPTNPQPMTDEERARASARLDELEMQMQQWQDLQLRTLQTYANDNSWVLPGTGGGFNRDQIIGGSNQSLAGRTEQQMRAVARMLQQKREALGIGQQDPSTPDPLAASPDQTVYDRNDVGDVNTRISRILRQSGSQSMINSMIGAGASLIPGPVGQTAPSFTGASRERGADRDAIDNLRTGTVRPNYGALTTHFLDMPKEEREAAFEEFSRDPSAYIEANL